MSIKKLKKLLSQTPYEVYDENLDEIKRENFLKTNKEQLDIEITRIALEEGKKDDDLPDYVENYIQEHSLEELSELIK